MTSTMYDFSFMISVFDLIDNPDFGKICEILHLNIQSAWLEQEYDAIIRGQGDVFLFHSQMGCVLLDLFQSPTDQNEMVTMGIRCKEELCIEIEYVLMG